MGRSSDFSTIPLSTRFETCQETVLRARSSSSASVVDRVGPSAWSRTRISRAVSRRRKATVRRSPRVEGRVEVVGASADPLDRDLAVADEPTEVVLRLSGGDVEVAAHPVEVDARRLADVSADPGSGVRHGCSS